MSDTIFRMTPASRDPLPTLFPKTFRIDSDDGPVGCAYGPTTWRYMGKKASTPRPSTFFPATLDGFGPLYAAGSPSYILRIVTDSQCSPAFTGARNSAHSPLSSPGFRPASTLVGTSTVSVCTSLPSIQKPSST